MCILNLKCVGISAHTASAPFRCAFHFQLPTRSNSQHCPIHSIRPTLFLSGILWLDSPLAQLQSTPRVSNLSSSKLSCKYSGWKRFTWDVLKLKMAVNATFIGEETAAAVAAKEEKTTQLIRTEWVCQRCVWGFVLFGILCAKSAHAQISSGWTRQSFILEISTVFLNLSLTERPNVPVYVSKISCTPYGLFEKQNLKNEWNAISFQSKRKKKHTPRTHTKLKTLQAQKICCTLSPLFLDYHKK